MSAPFWFISCRSSSYNVSFLEEYYDSEDLKVGVLVFRLNLILKKLENDFDFKKVGLSL